MYSKSGTPIMRVMALAVLLKTWVMIEAVGRPRRSISIPSPNSFLTSTIVTNFSKPEEASRFELYFTLDFSVDPERAIRVLLGGARDAIDPGGLLADPEPRVRMTAVTDSGYQYRLQYYLLPSKTSPAAGRHAAISEIARHMRYAGLSLAYRKQDVFHTPMPERQLDWQSETAANGSVLQAR